MTQSIYDGTKFKQLEHNPTKSREDSLYPHIFANLEMIKLLMTQHSTGFCAVVILQVFCISSPKVHKAGCPFRSIVSSVNTNNHNLASYLVGLLQPISTNQHTVKDSFSFGDWAKKYKHGNGIMCSLDVYSLFINIPLDETIQICLDKFLLIPRRYTSCCFKEVIRICHQENPLSF